MMLLFEHPQQQKLLISWQFSWPYGVIKCSSGWKKDVVNQCLGFACDPDPEDSKVIFSHDTPAYDGASPENFWGLAL